MNSRVEEPGSDSTESMPADGRSEPIIEEGSDPPRLPLDQVFDVLRNERRRLVLSKLTESDGPRTIGELAEHIAAHENDKPVTHLSSDERKRAYVGLYQCHLPKMDAMDIVRFNKDRGRVELGPNFSLVEPYLETEAPGGVERTWPRRYLALSATCASLVVLAAIAAPSTTLVASTVVVVLFAATSSYHWWMVSSSDGASASESDSGPSRP